MHVTINLLRPPKKTKKTHRIRIKVQESEHQFYKSKATTA
uniref:Uncharacterized protein n=1 Tax=Rhizophora mucronata TaxID=61149 RepID=A0A2P2LS33_RHIMU